MLAEIANSDLETVLIVLLIICAVVWLVRR